LVFFSPYNGVCHVNRQSHFGASTTPDENHGEQLEIAGIITIPHHGHNTIVTRSPVGCPQTNHIGSPRLSHVHEVTTKAHGSSRKFVSKIEHTQDPSNNCGSIMPLGTTFATCTICFANEMALVTLEV
jgi:hypothetical protein